MPGYTYIGLSIRDFHRGEIQARLADFGVTPLPAAPELTPALLQSWPGSRADTELLYFTDTEGLLYQLSSPDYCDGLCQSAEAVSDIDSGSSAAPLFMPTHLSHFTNRVADRERANRFHRLLFGIDYQAYQGPAAPIIGVGDGIQFLMYIGGGQSATGMPTAEVHHACFGIENFDLETNRRAMTDYGLSPIDDGAVPPPLSHWVSMRMPDRGGAENGTPELYFTDPDGIRMQLQHPAYCGGGGYLGNRCPPLPL